jgi:hypothetical protein
MSINIAYRVRACVQLLQILAAPILGRGDKERAVRIDIRSSWRLIFRAALPDPRRLL